jgi:hypothetical protein
MADEQHTGAEDDQVVVTREIDLDLPSEWLWDLVSDGSTWGDWLGSAADVDVVDGGAGRLVDDDGVARRVRVDGVDRRRGLRFTWWPEHDDGRRSQVELVVVPRPGGSRLRVREVLASARPDSAVVSQRAWDIRALVLWSIVAALQPV